MKNKNLSNTLIMLRYNLSLWSVIILCWYPAFVNAQVYEKTPELHGDSVVFPITIVNAFPFISGTVNGLAGKFMFDTGSAATIDLNDNFIQLPHKKLQGNGFVGSGQSFKTSISDTIREISFTNGITYRNLENIRSGNYVFLQEHITPDCIGYVGYNFFKGYLFKLDYLRRKITFYRSSIKRSAGKDYLKGEKILAVIDFEIRKLPNHPIVKLKIDGIDVAGAFDTGQYGSLQLDSLSAKALKKRGSVASSGTDGEGDTLLTVKTILFGRTFKTALKGLNIVDPKNTQVIKKVLGINESNLMSIGYRFLSQYKTVWDYADRKIYVLEY